MTHDYTSNITRKQFELIREDLESARKTTRPRTVDLYEVFCGVMLERKYQESNVISLDLFDN
jgi:hypothetical protein